MAVPPVVTGLNATYSVQRTWIGANFYGAVYLEWSKSTDATVTSYEIWRANTLDATLVWSQIAVTPDPRSWTRGGSDATALAGRPTRGYSDATAGIITAEYSYVVLARNASGLSAYQSTPATIVVPNLVPDKLTGVGALYSTDSQPHVRVSWDHSTNSQLTTYQVFRDGIFMAEVGNPIAHGGYFTTTTSQRHYDDSAINPNTYYVYTVFAVNDAGTSPISDPAIVTTEFFPTSDVSTVPAGVVRWTFTDYWQVGPTPYTYTFDINPNDGGSPSIQKNMTALQNTGPNRMNLVQEGQSTVPTIAFSGIILTQHHYETLEIWFDRRVVLRLNDDLGRHFYGVFSKFTPKRVRRGQNFWYHTYDAEFTASAYYNASGTRVYGRIL